MSVLFGANPPSRKKKKSKVKSELSSKEQDLNAVEDLVSKSTDREKSASGSDRNSPALTAGSGSTTKTDAEKRFEEVQKQRVCLADHIFLSCD